MTTSTIAISRYIRASDSFGKNRAPNDCSSPIISEATTRAAEAAHAADNDNDKGVDQNLSGHARVGGQQRPGDDPGKTGESGAEAEDAHKYQWDIDPQSVDHSVIVNSSPNDDAKPGFIEQKGHDQTDQDSAAEHEPGDSMIEVG